MYMGLFFTIAKGSVNHDLTIANPYSTIRLSLQGMFVPPDEDDGHPRRLDFDGPATPEYRQGPLHAVPNEDSGLPTARPLCIRCRQMCAVGTSSLKNGSHLLKMQPNVPYGEKGLFILSFDILVTCGFGKHFGCVGRSGPAGAHILLHP